MAIDKRLMKLAIRQVLDNALKYTSAETPVEMGAQVKDGVLSVEVTDYGKGIPAGEQLHGFFEASHRSPSVNGSNTGFRPRSLSIAHGIVRAHKGELTVSSRKADNLPNDAARAPAGGRLSAGRIIIVDDQPKIRRFMRTTLVAEGYEVDEAKTGEEALASIRERRPLPRGAEDEHARNGEVGNVQGHSEGQRRSNRDAHCPKFRRR